MSSPITFSVVGNGDIVKGKYYQVGGSITYMGEDFSTGDVFVGSTDTGWSGFGFVYEISGFQMFRIEVLGDAPEIPPPPPPVEKFVKAQRVSVELEPVNKALYPFGEEPKSNFVSIELLDEFELNSYGRFVSVELEPVNRREFPFGKEPKSNFVSVEIGEQLPIYSKAGFVAIELESVNQQKYPFGHKAASFVSIEFANPKINYSSNQYPLYKKP